MKIYSKEELNNYPLSLTYSDLGIIPALISDFTSRTEADTSIEFLGLKLSTPILSSPMSTVSGYEMCKALGELGCLGILNRFDDSLGNKDITNRPEIKAVSLGLHEDIDTFREMAYLNKIICIDTANAHSKQVIDKCIEIQKELHGDIKLIIGNIAWATPKLMKIFADTGVRAVRVTVGSGAGCITSIKTSVGVGSVSSILNIREAIDKTGVDIKLIADGGIKSSGNLVTALTMGANACIIGNMLAGSNEAPGKIIKFNNNKYKIYAGSASEFQKGNDDFIEGAQGLVPYRGEVKNIIKDLSDGIKSAMSYLNCKTIEELRNIDSKFIILTQNSMIERNSYL